MTHIELQKLYDFLFQFSRFMQWELFFSHSRVYLKKEEGMNSSVAIKIYYSDKGILCSLPAKKKQSEWVLFQLICCDRLINDEGIARVAKYGI